MSTSPEQQKELESLIGSLSEEELLEFMEWYQKHLEKQVAQGEIESKDKLRRLNPQGDSSTHLREQFLMRNLGLNQD